MTVTHKLLLLLTTIYTGLAFAQLQQALLPAPNGTYTVGLSIIEVVDEAHQQPFAPDTEPRSLELSIFYPTTSSRTTPVQYMPPETARYEDVEHSTVFSLNAPNGTFERLALQLAPNGSSIASASGKWPVLLFSGAQGTTRLFYNAICSQLSSEGYVVVSFDTPYDTDVVQFSDGSIVTLNNTLEPTEASAIIDVNARAQDASFILDQLSNNSFTSNLIPNCDDCLNTTQVGMFGHSLGGATSATVMLNDTRFAGGLDFDGALFGDVIDQGLSRPFMIMGTQGQQRANETQLDDPLFSWFKIWPKLTSPKFSLILNDSLHYTFSDVPIALEVLGIHPNETTLAKEQVTKMDGARALHIVTTYATTFFDFVLRGKAAEMLNSASADFPEIAVDDSAEAPAGSNATATSGSSSLVGFFESLLPAALMASVAILTSILLL